MQHAWIDVERPGGSHMALDGKKISWLITARSDYPCLQHARANTGRKVMGGGYNYSFLGLFWVCLLFVRVGLP